MAVPRKEAKDIAELGPIGILREGFKLYAAHFKVYILIQLVLMLPLVILLVVTEYFIFGQYLPVPPHNMNRGSPSPRAPRFVGAISALDLKGQLAVLLLSFAASVVFQAAVSLSLSTSLYSVGLHYSGQPVSFVGAVRAVTPRLWMRLVLITLYVNLITFSITLVQTVGNMLLLDSGLWLLVWSSVMAVLSLVVNFGIGIVFVIASGVSVLDESDYGWAAFKKALKLLKGKVKVAILFLLLWIVPGLIETGISVALIFQLSKDDFYAQDAALLSVTLVVFLVWTTLLWQLQSLCGGVLYVSFKAYHDESLSGFLHDERRPLVEGYERAGDERI